MIAAYPHTQSDLDRFDTRVEKTSKCWNWTGSTFENGYGVFTLRRKAVRAHRFAWHVANGRPIPDGLVIMHSCDNRICVNPNHLSLGTPLENVQDRNAKGRTARGEKTAKAKLTSDQVRMIREDTRGHKPVAIEFGVARSLVQRIRQGKGWNHVK